MKRLLLLFAVLAGHYGNAQQSPTVFEVAKSGDLLAAKEILIKDEHAFMTKDARGFTPLIMAVYSGNDEIVKYIMRYSDVNYLSPMGTALMAATVKGNLELVESLLENQANPNLTDANGVTALMYAVQFKNRPIIELLLVNSADKNKVDKNGRTAFELATATNDDAIIKLLK